MIFFIQYSIPVTTNIYTISTVVGTGSAGVGSDGLPALQTQINQPSGIWLSSNGILYFADSGNYVVRSLNAYETNPVVTIVAGTLGTSSDTADSGPATSATFSNPYGVCGLTTGVLYITDSLAGRIRSINTQGIINAAGGRSGILTCVDGGLGTSTLTLPTLCRVEIS